MNEKRIQVAIGLRKKGFKPALDQATLCGMAKGSYARDESKPDRKWRYDDLIGRFHDKDRLIKWLMEDGLLVKSRVCSVCGDDMKLVNCEDCSDGFKWECRSRINSKRHKVELSIRASSWFEQSTMTLEEILKYSY